MMDLDEHYQVELAYRNSMSVPPRCEARLAGVIKDTLAHPGSLTRAHLIFRMLRNFGASVDDALSTAISIEYFHTASLLLDDLPCMDDALIRRGQTCPHRRYGEAAAILGALAFINKAYALMWSGFARLNSERCREATRLVEECLGLMGVIQGQSLDVHFAESKRDVDQVAEIALGKTGAMIRLALLLPCIMLGLAPEARQLLEELSRQWGLAYQTLDDLKDLYDASSGKTSGRDSLLNHPNMAVCLGVDLASAQIEALLSACDRDLEQLCKISHAFRFLMQLQDKLRCEQSRLLNLAEAA